MLPNTIKTFQSWQLSHRRPTTWMISSPCGWKGRVHKAALLQVMAGRRTVKVNSRSVFTLEAIANPAACTVHIKTWNTGSFVLFSKSFSYDWGLRFVLQCFWMNWLFPVFEVCLQLFVPLSAPCVSCLALCLAFSALPLSGTFRDR